jgi:hypothetical protein
MPAAATAAMRLAAGPAARVRAATAKGTPWRARGALEELLADGDVQDASALLGLIDECPTLRNALASGARGPDGSAFFTTARDLARAKAFLARMSCFGGKEAQRSSSSIT